MTYSQLALVFKKHDNVWYVNTFEHGHFKLIVWWITNILQTIFFKHLFILYSVQAYKILLHFVPHTPIWIPIYERIRHQREKNKINFCSLRITAFQIYKMTDWHFHATHQIPILSVLKAALQLVWKRLSLDVQNYPPPPPPAAECNITLEIHSSLSASKSSAVRLASEYSLMCDSGCESERERIIVRGRER